MQAFNEIRKVLVLTMWIFVFGRFVLVAASEEVEFLERGFGVY